jgi:UDP-GlcNAc:undecaprenyl-phosphate GlcNAc-1-phosphate transferase
MNPFFQLTLAAAVSMLLIPLARHVAPRLGLVDMPEARKVHTAPTPRVGGWGITLGALLPIVLVFGHDPLVQSFLIGCAILFAFGIWDDARTIGHWTKFAGQFAAVATLVYHGGLWVSRVPFLQDAIPAWVGKPFTMFALIGVINAINHSDGLDGLAAGESVLSLMALAILGYLSGNALVLGLSLATIGGIFGFLRYNSHPAFVFMGDSGSQVLGFTLGFLVVYLTQSANTAVSAALPLLIIGLPIADILSVLYQRIRGGMNWFLASRNHIHHRLMQLGFEHYETVVIIYLIQAALVVSAVVARYQSDTLVMLVYLSVIAGLLCAITVAERRGWRVPRDLGARSKLARALAGLRASGLVLKGPLVVITAITPTVMLLSAFGMASISSDFAMVAAGLAVLCAVQLLWPRTVHPVLLQLVVYATAILPAYLLVSYPGAIPSVLQAVTIAIICVLAVAVVLYARFSGERRFRTTPTDYLIVCGAVALMAFGSVAVNSQRVVEALLFAIVLMYACEVIVATSPGTSSRRVLQLSTLAALLIITFRGVL